MFKRIMDCTFLNKYSSCFPVVLLMLLSFNIKNHAQETSGKYLSLEEAVITTLNNSPELKNAALQVKRSRVMKNGALEFDPFEIVYHYGQINAPVNDRYLEINQSFGSLLTLVRQYE